MSDEEFEKRDLEGAKLLRRIEIMSNPEELLLEQKLILINQSINFYKIVLTLQIEKRLRKDIEMINNIKEELDESLIYGINEEQIEIISYLFKTIHEINKYIAKVGEIYSESLELS